jgi:hypothetical protein
MKHISIPLLLALAAPVFAQDVGTLLKDADRFRMSADNLQVDTQVQTFNADGTPDKERRYTVFAQAGRQSLVLMQSPAEKGQKVLMLADDFWLLMPGSQRPLRITPMQKLLGDASTGDIATHSVRHARDAVSSLTLDLKCVDRSGCHTAKLDFLQVVVQLFRVDRHDIAVLCTLDLLLQVRLCTGHERNTLALASCLHHRLCVHVQGLDLSLDSHGR